MPKNDRVAATAARSRASLRLPFAAALLGVAGLAAEAAAHVRVPDERPILRRLEQSESGPPATSSKPEPEAAPRPAAASAPCRAWGPEQPLTTAAAFAFGTTGAPAVALRTVHFGSPTADDRAPADLVPEVASLVPQLPLLFSGFFSGTPGTIEVAEGRTRDGAACPVFVAVGRGEFRQVFWRFAPPDEPEGWFDSRGRRLAGAAFAPPRPGSRISSTFGIRRYYGRVTSGAFHDGIDFEARIGDPIYAAADGVIEHQGWYFEYGLTTKVQHAAQFTTLYAHMARFAPGVALGSRVTKGQLIGFVGMTGRSTGAHLHFSAIANGKFVDPALYLAERSDRPLSAAALALFRQWQGEIEALLRASEEERSGAPPEAEWTTRT